MAGRHLTTAGAIALASMAWEVKVRSAAGVIWEVELAPDGTVVDAEIDD